MTKYSGKFFGGKIGIFVKVIFNFSAEIGVFGLTFRVKLLSRCDLKILLLIILFLEKHVHALGKNINNFLNTLDQCQV